MKWLQSFSRNKILLIFFLGLGLLVTFQHFLSASQASDSVKSESWNVDTVIPAGQVLIPIQILNLESVSPLIGKMGVVDLWTFNPESQKKSKKIAHQIKIIRAPLDPMVFAILVPDEESKEILQYGDQFYVTLHHPNRSQTKKQKKIHLNKPQFETFNEEKSYEN